MAAEFIYTLRKAGRFYPPDREVLRDVTLAFLGGAKIGVIGHNGSGKSSLLRIMAGLDDGYTGEARLALGAAVGLLPQEPELDASMNVEGNVMSGVAATAALLAQYEAVLAGWSDPDADFDALGTQQAELEDRIASAGAWDLERQVAIAMDALRLPPPDADVTTLSGGERRRVALCRLLLSHPDLLLLDEPTNHLDAESVAWLERFLADYSGTVVAITHDRYFLDNVAGWILEIDHGRTMPFEGNYSAWLERKAARMAAERSESDARARTLARELEWVRMSPRARQAKSRARVNAYEELLAAHRDTATEQRRADALQITIPMSRRLGSLVIEANGLSKAFGDKLLFDDLSFSLPPGGIVGVIGANGAGKTTLFRMLVGDEVPDAGSITVGETTDIAYVDQSRARLDDSRTVYTEITDGHDTLRIDGVGGAREVNGRAFVASFNFTGSDQQKRVGELAGGERNRVHLARTLTSGCNVLMLDEPTNDLDVDTLRSLEDALESFGGCAVVISHDRWFLDRIATHVLAFEGDSVVRWFEGNFSDYEAFRKRELGAAAPPTGRGSAAAHPRRITYKPLAR
ncbi:energy-dependent translational throttle protein EttA [Candidatus Poriferisodalis sp.]|uniref:energy-dependent translational throttle protein EttA n=1 Tax=Candidatus Poriferisodalis sp. TaxID=3101277 RepID=UPI003D14D32D